jgi:PAS domain S-box-containing protein
METMKNHKKNGSTTDQRQADDPSSLTVMPDIDGLTNIFVYSPVGIFIVQNGKFAFTNPAFQKISGYEKPELRNMTPDIVIHPQDIDKVKENAVKMLKGERTFPYVYRAVTKNGETRWIIESVASVRFGGHRAVLGYFMDNTEQENAKNAVRRSEEKFQKAFRSIPDPVIISRLNDGTFIDANEAFFKASGYTREEFIGNTAFDLGIWPDQHSRDDMLNALAEKGNIRDLETRFRLKSGEIRFVVWSAEVIMYDDEKCLIVIGRDITERKRAVLDIGAEGMLI